MPLLLSGCTGLGFRRELSTDLLAAPALVEFVEIVAESCMAQRAARREACALAEVWPVVPHGVTLSLGSAAGIERAHVARLGALARELRAPLISEHIAFTRGGAREIGHLTRLPHTRVAVVALARNVARARAWLPDVPLLLENVAWSFRWPEDEMDEASFHCEVIEATGCDLLLDVGNLYANACNAGADPHEVLARYPLGRVAMIHVAGGVTEDGFYFDTHAHPIAPPVLGLLAAALAACPDVPVLIERDANFGAFAALRDELETIRALRQAVGSPHTDARAACAVLGRRGVPSMAPATAAMRALADRQAQVAAMLTERVTPRADLASGIADSALDRARGILERKRADEGIRLLARLARRGASLQALAARVTRAHARSPRGAVAADAHRIAAAASLDPSLRDDALHDRLVLRARFRGPDARGSFRVRRAPFVGHEQLDDGSWLRAVKGFGASASIHLDRAKERPWTAIPAGLQPFPRR